MATVDRIWRSPAANAASRALDRDIEASLEGRDLHPDGTAFIPEDLATPDVVESHRRDGSHVAIVSETGAIKLIRPRLKTEEKLIFVVVAVAGALLWAARARVPA
jgi:hypothetical protein